MEDNRSGIYQQIRQGVRELEIKDAVRHLIEGPESDLDRILRHAGYEPNDLKGVIVNREAKIFVRNEQITQKLSQPEKIPSYQNKQTTFALDIAVMAEYSAQIAVVENDSARLFDISISKEIKRHLERDIPQETLARLNIMRIIREEGYNNLGEKGPILMLPGYQIVGVRNVKVLLKGTFTRLGDDPYQLKSKIFEVEAAGDLKVTGDMLIQGNKGLLYLALNISQPVKERYDISPKDAKELMDNRPPSVLPQFKGKVDLTNAKSVNSQYKAKRNDLYQKWIGDELKKLPIDENVRKQLGISLNEPTYSGEDALRQLGERALQAISKITT